MESPQSSLKETLATVLLDFYCILESIILCGCVCTNVRVHTGRCVHLCAYTRALVCACRCVFLGAGHVLCLSTWVTRRAWRLAGLSWARGRNVISHHLLIVWPGGTLFHLSQPRCVWSGETRPSQALVLGMEQSSRHEARAGTPPSAVPPATCVSSCAAGALLAAFNQP